MKFRDIFIIMFFAVVFFGYKIVNDYEKEEKTKELSISYENDIVRERVERLKKECPNLFIKAVADIQSISVKNFKTTDLHFQKEEFGWEEAIEVEVKLNDKLKVVPNSEYVAGYILIFNLDMNSEEGVHYFSSKVKDVCDWQDFEDNFHRY